MRLVLGVFLFRNDWKVYFERFPSQTFKRRDEAIGVAKRIAGEALARGEEAQILLEDWHGDYERSYLALLGN